jgi:nitrate reductase gamma subunit
VITDRVGAARRTAVETGLFWVAVLALAVGVVTLFLALAVSLIGAATGGDRSSMAAVYFGFGIGGLAVAGLVGLAYRAVRPRNRNAVVSGTAAERSAIAVTEAALED